MSGSAYTALPTPVVANPLQAIKSGIDAANAEYGVREKQAQQAVGNILQQATDANGNVDYPKAQALAAQAGPVVQMGMQTMLKDTSVLQAQQTTNAAGRMKFVAQSAITIARNPSDENVNASFDNLAAHGVPAGQVASERARWLAMTPEQRQDEATRHGMFAIDQLNRTVGTTTMQTYGGTTAPTTVVDPTGRQPGSAVVGQGVAHSVTPGDMVEVKDWVDAKGNVVPSNTPGASERTRTVHKSQVPGVPQGPPVVPSTGGGTGTGTGTGTGPPIPPPPGTKLIPPDYQSRPGATAPALPAPATTAAPAPVVAPAPTAPTAVPFGAYTIGNPAGAPAPAAPAPAAPATPAPTVPPAVTPAPTTPAPTGLVTSTAPPIGVPEKQKADVAAYTEDQATYPVLQTRAQNLAHAYDALDQLKSATGKGASGINTLRSYAQTLGILPAGAVNEQRLVEILTKYTEREMITAAGGSTTDMGRRMQEQANAGTLLSTSANTEILRNDMGLKLQAMAAYKDHKDTSGTGYLKGRADVADSTDPRGFVWNLYSSEEKAKINAEVDRDPVAADKLHKAIGMTQRLKLQIPGLTAPRAEATPTAAPPNALAMAPAQSGNPLLAA